MDALADPNARIFADRNARWQMKTGILRRQEDDGIAQIGIAVNVERPEFENLQPAAVLWRQSQTVHE